MIFKRQSGGKIFYSENEKIVTPSDDSNIESNNEASNESSTPSIRENYNHFINQYSTEEDIKYLDDYKAPKAKDHISGRAKNSKLYKAWVKMRGEDKDDDFNKFIKLLGTISFVETRRENIKTRGKSSAKGYFQFINDAVVTNKQRARNAINDYGIDRSVFKNILNIGKEDVMNLSTEDQAIMALLHMHYSLKIPLGAYLEGRVDDSAIYEGWVSDSGGKDSIYKEDQHLVNFKNKKKEIQKYNLNSKDKVLNFLFGSDVVKKNKNDVGVLYNNDRKVKKSQLGLKTKDTILSPRRYDKRIRASRIGSRLNYDKQGRVTGESSHLMAWGDNGKGRYYAFPTLFQRKDSSWYEPKDPYAEAIRKGEVYDFGTNKQQAIDFAGGSWKLKLINNNK